MARGKPTNHSATATPGTTRLLEWGVCPTAVVTLPRSQGLHAAAPRVKGATRRLRRFRPTASPLTP